VGPWRNYHNTCRSTGTGTGIEDDIAPTNLADGFASEDDLFTFL